MFDFESIYLATSAADASRALSEHPDAVLICGGTDVLIKIREGKLAGCKLISINELPELKGVALEQGDIHIKAATTFAELEEDTVIRRHIPILAHAAGQAGGPQLRRVGTVGGNVCNGVTSADTATSLLVLDATLRLLGGEQTREIPLREFYIAAGKTQRKQHEVLTELIISRENYEGFFGHYIKYAQRNAMDIATLGCAGLVKLTDDKTRIMTLRLAYGVAAPTPVLCPEASEFAVGKEISDETIDQIAQIAVSSLNPRTSWRASREFRLQIAYELAKRVIATAIGYAGGVSHA